MSAQQTREFKLVTPLGEDVLLFRHMTVEESLGRPYTMQIHALSIRHDINLEELLGEKVTVEMGLQDGSPRYFNGLCVDFTYAGNVGSFASYHLTARPWFWLLTRNSDCRIFQNMTVPEIVRQVFGDRGFSDIEDRLSETYRTWENCVQYRETDFNFCCRLMEQEGIYFYFKHEIDRHVMILADSADSHDSMPGYEQVPYFPPENSSRRERDHVNTWSLRQTVQPGRYALNEYNFTEPTSDMLAEAEVERDHVHASFEIYDYPGEYNALAEGTSYSETRIEELHANFERVNASGNARGLASGSIFTLIDHPRADQNRDYLIVSTQHDLQSGGYAPGSNESASYNCSIEAIPANTPFRPARTMPKPVVHGSQTAMVTGPAGQEIWTDQYGRVIVQFHWDRYGEEDENSSCWMRVSQVHAGKGFGGVDIPRIGEEVIVSFLEGDPDRPIVTGRVYNDINEPPTSLPGAGMVSGLKSNSTPGGGGYNEMVMDDTKGEEKISIHGQYNMDTTIENDSSLTVHNNRTATVDVNDTLTVGGEQSRTITGASEHHVIAAVTENYDDVQTTTVVGNITTESTTGEISLTAAQKITLTTGASSITMDAAGNIAIEGINVTVNGVATLAMSAISITSEATAQHETKGALVISDGTATNTVKGGVVMLNP